MNIQTAHTFNFPGPPPNANGKMLPPNGFSSAERIARDFGKTPAGLVQFITTLEKRNETLAVFSQKVLQAQEEERKRISRGLHDEVEQALTAISVALQILKKNGRSKILQKKISATQRLLAGAMETVHQFVGELRPPMLDELGLLPALRSMVRSLGRRAGLKIVFCGNQAVENLTVAQKTVLFRVAQEYLGHVTRLGARHLKVAIRKQGDGICMMITDDGKRFRHARQKTHPHVPGLDLSEIQERLRLVDAQLSVKTKLNKVTHFQVLISPLDKFKPS